MPDDVTAAVVPEDYDHLYRTVSPGPPLVLPDTYLKWHRLYPENTGIDPATEAEARDFLTAEVAAGRLPISGDLGFVVHHRCGERVHLLLVCTWRAGNEMWETVYVQDGGFALMPQTTHRAVMCVWEFGAIAHEHHAWTTYLRSGRDAAARQRYAESQLTITL